MKKLFKAVASIVIGCAMLQASAFAAISGGTIDGSSAPAMEVIVSGVTGQSTILVTKSVSGTEGNYTIPNNLADSDIVYINQLAAGSGSTTYSFNIGDRASDGDTLYFFAGGTNESSAVYLGKYELTAPAAETTIIIAKDGSNDTYFIGATGGEYGSAFRITFERPAAATSNDAIFGITAGGSRRYSPKQVGVLTGLTGTVTLDVSFLNGSTAKGKLGVIEPRELTGASVIMSDNPHTTFYYTDSADAAAIDN